MSTSNLKSRLTKLEQQHDANPKFVPIDARPFGSDTEAALEAWTVRNGRQVADDETVIFIVSEC